jgi:hypothetical protein
VAHGRSCILIAHSLMRGTTKNRIEIGFIPMLGCLPHGGVI